MALRLPILVIETSNNYKIWPRGSFVPLLSLLRICSMNPLGSYRCHVSTIVEALHREAAALHLGLLRLQAHANFTPDAQVEEARLLVAQLHLKVQQQWQLPTDGDPDDAAAYRCEACHRTFTSYRLLRAHEAKWHGKKTPQTLHPTFDRNAHGLNGMPTCRHCRHPFRQWDGLVKHPARTLSGPPKASIQGLRLDSLCEDRTNDVARCQDH